MTFTSVDLVKASRESLIEEAIMADPGRLGFPGALPIRRCRVAEPCGLVDLLFLPLEGPVKLVLVEAKGSSAPDAASKVFGQLIMYYAGALMLGSDGLRLMRAFAVNHPEQARSTAKVSPKALTGGFSPPQRAWHALYAGAPLKPSEIALFIAIDGDPHRAFDPTLSVLRDHHALQIRYCVVQNGTVDRVIPSAAG